MRLCSIASGSSGNCVYVGSDTTHLLMDVGISGKRTEAGLAELGLTMKDIDAICITHEHADHISGLGVLARKYGVPIVSSIAQLLPFGDVFSRFSCHTLFMACSRRELTSGPVSGMMQGKDT